MRVERVSSWSKRPDSATVVEVVVDNVERAIKKQCKRKRRTVRRDVMVVWPKRIQVNCS